MMHPVSTPPLPAVSTTKGDATVRFVHDDARQWYVFKSTYGREEKAADILISAGIYAYVAKRYERIGVGEQDGTPHLILKSFIPNVFFAYLTRAEAALFMGDSRPTPSPAPSQMPSAVESLATAKAYADFFYVRPDKSAGGRPLPLTVSEQTMHSFILTTATFDERIYLLGEGTFRIQDDADMLVTDGKFRGVIGKKIRAYSQQRILIELKGLASVGTPYIPSSCLQKIAS